MYSQSGKNSFSVYISDKKAVCKKGHRFVGIHCCPSKITARLKDFELSKGAIKEEGKIDLRKVRRS